MKKVAKRVISFVLVAAMVFTSTLFGFTEEVKADTVYDMTVTAESFSGNVGDTITLTADVTDNGTEVTDLNASGLAVYWWCTNNENNGVSYDSSSSRLTNDVTINATGEYYFTVKLQETTGWTTIKEVYVTVTGTEAGEPTYTIEVMQDGEVVSGASGATGTAVVGEDTTFTAKIIKTDDDGTQTEITDLTGYHLYWYDQATDTTTEGALTFTVNKDAVGEYWFDVTLQDSAWNTLDTTWFGVNATEESVPEYEIEINLTEVTGEEGEKITLTVGVSVDGNPVTDLAANKLAVYWWTDDNENNGVTYDSSNSTLTNEITLNKAGTYNFTVKLNNAENPWNTWKTTSFTLIVEEGENPVIDYEVSITPETTEIKKGDTVKVSAKVTVDDEEVTDLQEAELSLVWSASEEGLQDIEFGETEEYSSSIDVTLPSDGSYFLNVDVVCADGEVVATAQIELIAQALDDEAKKIDLPNDDFSEDIVDNDPVWKGTTKSGSWQGNLFYRFKYSSDAWLELASYCSGAYCMKMEAAAGDALSVVQYMESLKAGTYTVVIPVMGDDGSVKVILGNQESETQYLRGWNNWSYVKVTFVIEEDMTDVPVGIKLVSSNSVGGWAFVDSISLYQGVPDTGDHNMVWGYVILLLAGVAVTMFGLKKKQA